MSQSQNISSQNYAIIVAGGSGTRMQAAIPKQFLHLHGRPILFYTLEAFYNCQSRPHLLLVLHPDFHEYWHQLCRDFDFKLPHTLVAGGATRFDSVKNGLSFINDPSGLIAVHDAVRPLTPAATIDEAFVIAKEQGNAIVAVKSRDSVRQVQNNISKALLRDEIYLIQTPQTFTYEQLSRAYEQTYSEAFTDDASVVEKAGYPIHLLEGDYTNIKITFPEDIAIAELLINKKPSA